MKLKEIELDIPYRESEDRLQQIQEKRGIDRQEAIKIDYELHWKAKRRRFQLETRCMTAMIERIMKPVKTENCWKLLFECYEEIEENEVVKLLGVYVVRTKFSLEKFWESDSYNKKKMIIETILAKVNEIKNNITFDLENINMACEKIISLGYVNEWVWGKPLKLGKKYVHIEMKHEVQEMYIYMVFFYAKGEIINKILLAHTVPDEWNYYEYLGELVKISDNSAALVTKKGERLIGGCKSGGKLEKQLDSNSS